MGKEAYILPLSGFVVGLVMLEKLKSGLGVTETQKINQVIVKR